MFWLSLLNLTQPWKFLDAPLDKHCRIYGLDFPYTLDHFEHARSRTGASARRGEAPLYLVYVAYQVSGICDSPSILERRAVWQQQHQ